MTSAAAVITTVLCCSLFKIVLIGGTLLYNFVLLSGVRWEAAINIYISLRSWASLSSPCHPAPLGHQRVPGWAPCVIQQLPTNHLFTWYCIYVSATFSICPTLTLPSEKALAPHPCTLAWKIPWTEEPGRLHTVHGVTKSRKQLSDFTFTLSYPH